ncbi:MAG: histidine phosphatase family protein [Rhizobiaceae bacterium]|nr:histidine phosphatase family protein [Rhizobiaceae bacterium]
MIDHKQFYYIRHGETDWNMIGKLQGKTDIPLNETGIAQANLAKEILSGIAISTICCSPMLRARKTAEVINETLDVPIVEIDDLRECNFGSLEGTTSYPWISNWLVGDSTNVPGDIEPLEQFIARCAKAINHAITHPGPVLIVAHGGSYLPAKKGLPESQQSPLQNCAPVRHDPPLGQGGMWRRTDL